MAGRTGSGPRPRRVLRALGRLGLRLAIDPVIAVPGYWVATALGGTWALLASRGPLATRIRPNAGLLVADRLPSWAFGRGGTMIGGVLLTSPQLRLTPEVLRHERAHRRQWRRYGLAFIPLYLAAGRDPLTNRFEIEAGLVDGGYLPRQPS